MPCQFLLAVSKTNSGESYKEIKNTEIKFTDIVRRDVLEKYSQFQGERKKYVTIL